MTKEETIVLRVSTENKQTIKAAADSVDKSLTTFVIDAALKQAEQVKRRPPARGVHGGLASWFRATCYEASKGGTGGYEAAGFKLAAALGSEIPGDIEDDEWPAEVEKLEALLDGDDDRAVIDWFEQHYPRFIALVPSRRRAQFVAGVVRAHREGEIEL
jgi:Protein of unknown function (DUF1778)